MNGPPTTGFFNVATRSRTSSFSTYPNSSTPPRINSGSIWPVRIAVGSKGPRWGECRAKRPMMDKVKRNSIVVFYIAIVVTIMLLMMIGVL